MPRLDPKTCLFFALACGVNVIVGRAAEPVPSAPANSSSTSTPAKPRAISSATAAQLAALAPKYAPAPTPAATPVAEARGADRPRNAIIRLPSYVVDAPRIRLPNHRDILTPTGRLAVALKRNPGLHFNPLWFLGSNNGVALGMLEEEYRLERIAEAMGLTSLLSITDPDYPAVKRAVNELTVRPSAHGPGSWVSGGGPFQIQR